MSLTFHRRHAHTFFIAALCAIVLVATPFSVGCKREPPPPPPPPAPPPPPPPPPPLTEAEVGHRMRPLFLVLYERGFNPTALASPSRWAAGTAPQGTMPPGVAKAAEEAAAKTPPLTRLIRKESERAGIDPATVLKCANDLAAKLPAPQAREILMAIYVLQALKDADDGNLHRAHVLLTDVLTEMNDGQAEGMKASIAGLRRFFLEVPDEKRLQDFARQLDRYVKLQEENILLYGEHAAILQAGGFAAAADFTREKLLTQFDLITLPLIDLATARGESYGFRRPDQLRETRRRLNAHAEALRATRPPERDDSFRTKAEFTPAPRSIAELMEVIGTHVDLLAAACPIGYDPEKKEFFAPDLWSVVRDAKRLEATAAWCAGKQPADVIVDGTGHVLLAAHWLENNRPELARTAFVAGAEKLLEPIKVIDVGSIRGEEDGRREQLAKALISQLNAYRLLMAASLISASPPGAHVDSRDSYLPQLEVLLLAWKQIWLKCGLPQKPADAAIAEFARNSEAQRRRIRERSGGDVIGFRNDRYFFFDYRFRTGDVPEILVAKASADELVENPRIGELAGTERFLEFVKSFQKPRQFSPGFTTRWK
jgi:hypothetical protein